MSLRVLSSADRSAILPRVANAVVGGIVIAVCILLLVALQAGWIDILPAGSAEAEPAAEAEAAAPPATLELPPEKLAAANLHVTQVVNRSIRPTRSVPATIDYDPSRRLSITAPVDGMLLKVLVEPAQAVAAGQPLAVLSSREVGLARDEVLQRDAELELARREQAFADEIAANVDELLALLRQKPKLEDLETALAGKTLGEYRESLVGAYSKLQLAEVTASSSGDLGEGAISRRIIEQRRSDREVAAAQLAAAQETARFAAAQSRQRAQAATEQAERMLAVSQQALANLLGPLADQTPVAQRERLSELVLLAPAAGRIEERRAVTAARVETGESLFTIADTSLMWVKAEIHERDWQALDHAPQEEMEVRIPALGEQPLTARVRFVGAEVSPETRSVPLVAEIDNADGRLRPGMFAWALVPVGAAREALVVPRGAVMRHENQAFLFAADGERSFRRVDVATGLESGDFVEIRSGLSAGQRIVDRGAFYLKSELLLEREE